MDERKLYKSPFSAVLWSVAFPGFGQFYNGDYLLGFLFMVLELTINHQSRLNWAIIYAFQKNFENGHHVINYEWGMFYPSVLCFCLWQAFNRAKEINWHLEQKGVSPPKNKASLTGILFGQVVGMNFGFYWHHFFFYEKVLMLRLLDIPVMNAFVFGLFFGFIGYAIEKYFRLTKQKN
ncbi:hypothetical protein [Heyndrickxia coagulans]|uniref:DUF5683 domain-containing protein n=1 Tax=Heyndrickxia coagulans TaxID=1398 RepID=A0A150KHW3_HEYCO|nr:hypothetical protein [Heyndrickxia coagulans]KYC72953.1 hypothetical protein B4099_2354 [Heyndrickxia coagulans]